MQTSVFLARLIGPVLVLVGISMLIDPASYVSMAAEFMKSPALLYLGAALGLLGGMALILTHNLWVADWRIIITLLGWVTLVDSISWLLFPRKVAAFWSPLLEVSGFPLIAGLVVVLLL